MEPTLSTINICPAVLYEYQVDTWRHISRDKNELMLWIISGPKIMAALHMVGAQTSERTLEYLAL